MTSADDRTDEWFPPAAPFVVENGRAVLWLAGPGWTDGDVRAVAGGLREFRVTVCGPGACPRVWMRPGDFGTVWHQPEMTWWPIGQGANFGSLHNLTPRYTPQEAYLRQPQWQWAVHEYGHLLGMQDDPRPGWMYSRAPLPPWHPDQIREVPTNSPAMVNIKNHTNGISVGKRWIDRPRHLTSNWQIVPLAAGG